MENSTTSLGTGIFLAAFPFGDVTKRFTLKRQTSEVSEEVNNGSNHIFKKGGDWSISALSKKPFCETECAQHLNLIALHALSLL